MGRRRDYRQKEPIGSVAACGLSIGRQRKPNKFRLFIIDPARAACSRRVGILMGSNQTSEQTMNTITIKNGFANKTEAEIDAGIDEAIAEAVRIGMIVPTGKTEWSERRQCLMPVYKSLIYQPLLSEVEPLGQA
jgi:hypothetical protein